MKKIALHWKIIIGMALGILYGVIASRINLEHFTFNWIKPWGIIFINLLKLIAVPLIFASILKGITSLFDVSKLSRIGGKTIILYLISTILSVSIGLILVNSIEPGVGFNIDSFEVKSNSSDLSNKIDNADQLINSGPLKPIIDIVPENMFFSASDNRNMLQIIFISILFGIAILTLPHEKTKHFKYFINNLNDIILKIVDLIMLISPYGVFALIASLIVDFGGDQELFIVLGKYSGTVIIGLLLMALCIYPLIINIFTNIKFLNFIKSILPAQMLAFSTSSSAATLPVTMKNCESSLGISKQVSSFVLPLGATINMDGTSLYQSVAAVFIAQVFGFSLDFTDQLTIVLTATLASIGSAAVPGAGMIMLIIVLESVPSLPSDIIAPGIALIFGVDRILDMLRTVVNVTGDATVATVVDFSERKNN